MPPVTPELTAPAPPPRRPAPATLAILAVVVAGGLWLGGRLDGEDPADAARAATLDAGAGAGIAALDVRTVSGAIRPVAGTGEPTVVMVISETCAVCKEALRDFGRAAAGRPLRRLHVVTLEGAAAGVPIVNAADVRGATLSGPVSPAAEALFTFQLRGTPTFLALDERGRVLRVVPGYPGRDAFRPWVATMLAERASP
jgi:thioredoxin-related protein